jgi:hypothetical protein
MWGCDFADIKFRLEFRLTRELLDRKERSVDGIFVFARKWMENCPSSLESLEEFYGDHRLKALYAAYRTKYPRDMTQMKKHTDPARIRSLMNVEGTLIPPYLDWDKIQLSDPDDNGNLVTGKIGLIIVSHMDVILPSLNKEHPTQERHVLVPCSANPDAAARFQAVTSGNRRTIKKTEREVKGGKKSVVIINYASKQHIGGPRWPLTYVIGYYAKEFIIDNKIQIAKEPAKGSLLAVRAWSRTVFKTISSSLDSDINDDRRKAGQDPISITK